MKGRAFLRARRLRVTVVLSNFDIRVLNGLLNAEAAGVNLTDQNGERRALD